MKRTYKAIAGVAAALSLALAATVYAHPGAGMGPGHGMGPGQGMGPGMGRGMGPVDMAAAASDRSAQLKAELKITSAQEAAWKTYETAVAQQAAAMQAMRTQMQALMQNAQPGITAPDWAAQREAMFRQREAGLQAHTAAVKELYAVLTPEQRAIADRHMGPGGGYRMGGWHRMR